MSHRINKLLIGVVVIAAVVGGVVYWEWPVISHQQRPEGDPASAVDLLQRATTSVLESLPRPTLGPPTAAAVPTVRWVPNSVTQMIVAGESKTVSVSFTAAEAISSVVVRVVPELQSFVHVTPAVLGSITKGQMISL